MYGSCLRYVFVSACLIMAWPAIAHAQLNAPLSAGLNDTGSALPDASRGVVPVTSPGPVMAVTASTPGTTAGSPVRPGTTPAAVAPVDGDRMPEPVQWWPPRQPVGDATREILSMQADPARPGPDHQVLGATASRSWQRYLDSFTHPVPLKFDAEVKGGPKQ